MIIQVMELLLTILEITMQIGLLHQLMAVVNTVVAVVVVPMESVKLVFSLDLEMYQHNLLGFLHLDSLVKDMLTQLILRHEHLLVRVVTD